MSETVLIVDDEDSVRRTFQEWLAGSGLAVRIFAVADAESALLIANEHPVDLAVLDWNLGSGSDGLRLLEDLVEFRPDIVAILVTGFAHQATPLDALRMGVRDYLDKNHDLNRETFLASIRKQLDRIRPAKVQREFHRSLASFREAVEKALPIIQAAAALNDPVPLPEAIKSLLGFVGQSVGAASGALIIRQLRDDGTEATSVFNAEARQLTTSTIPFSRSLAATVVSMQEPCVWNEFDPAGLGAVELHPFEMGIKNLIAAPLLSGQGSQAVMEFFNKPAPGFTAADRKAMTAAAEVGADLLRRSLAERQTHRLLYDAVTSALASTATMAESLAGAEAPPPQAMLDRLREGLDANANAVIDADATLKLVDAVRGLALRHGPAAVEHCVRGVTQLQQLLDDLTGS